MADSKSLGTGWGFPPQFYNNGKDVRLVSEAEDVKEALEILFTTAIQERLHYPEYGCDLKKFMFEEINRTLVIQIRQLISETAKKYESRIHVQNIDITQSETDAHLLFINIDYDIKTGTTNIENTVQTIILPLSLY